jgi:predicted AAA+ superfamily ATPase
MDETIAASLRRISEALERLAPPVAAKPDFSSAKVWRHEPSTGAFRPAADFALPLDLLVGVDRQKQRLVEAVSRFAAGFPTNHVLLWGSRGAGKSALAKAVFATAAQGAPSLRLVEVDRDHVTALPALFDVLRGLDERFVVLCDDLSFEDGAAAAKALKSALEGGVAGPPANAMFVATSNRRHLMPRSHTGREGPLSSSEDAEEEVSVSDRFGLWIGFGPMDQETYLAAVRGYARRFGLETGEIEQRALVWARIRGGRSGRVAWQFIRDLAGELGRPLPL